MSNILFAWERGGGCGHIVAHIPLLHELTARGHRVLFAVKNTATAEQYLGPAAIPYVQAPHPGVRAPEFRRINPLDSLPQMIYNVGYHDPDSMVGRLRSWRNLFDLFQPDILAVDFAPTALLAAKGAAISTLAIGTSFLIPPKDEPVPSFRFWARIDPHKLRRDENRLLEAMNQANAAFGIPPSSDVSDLIQGDNNWLRTIPELDVYHPRDNMSYRTYQNNGSKGVVPNWPKGNGKRVFGYLKPTPAILGLIEALKTTDCSTLLYAPGLGKEQIKRLESEKLRFSPHPLRMDHVVQECDLAVSHASHGTVMNLMVAGKPMLLLAEHVEHLVNARKIMEAGTGLAWSLLEKGMNVKLQDCLNQLLHEPQWTEKAAKLGTDLSQRTSDTPPEVLADEIDLYLLK